MSQDADLKQESSIVATTPPLTPVSVASFPTVAIAGSTGSPRTSNSFFASSYYDGGGNSGTGEGSYDEEPESVPTQEHVRLALKVLIFSFGGCF